MWSCLVWPHPCRNQDCLRIGVSSPSPVSVGTLPSAINGMSASRASVLELRRAESTVILRCQHHPSLVKHPLGRPPVHAHIGTCLCLPCVSLKGWAPRPPRRSGWREAVTWSRAGPQRQWHGLREQRGPSQPATDLQDGLAPWGPLRLSCAPSRSLQPWSVPLLTDALSACLHSWESCLGSWLGCTLSNVEGGTIHGTPNPLSTSEILQMNHSNLTSKLNYFKIKLLKNRDLNIYNSRLPLGGTPLEDEGSMREPFWGWRTFHILLWVLLWGVQGYDYTTMWAYLMPLNYPLKKC